MRERVAVVGVATSPGRRAELKADELGFDLVSAALRQAGLKGLEVDKVVLSSMDLYDGRAISNGLVVPAVGGYLRDETRVEGDSALAVVAGVAGVLARQSEVTVVVVHNTAEISDDRTRTATDLRRFTDEISRFGFDGHHVRPLGTTASAVLGLQAAYARDVDGHDLAGLAERAARDVNAGTAWTWSDRTSPVTAADVLAAEALCDPLTELMAPGEAAGAIALVLVSEARAARLRTVRGWVDGWGVSTAPYLSSPTWLRDPGAPTRAALQAALSRSARSDLDDLAVVEHTSLTTALEPYIEKALHLEPDDTRVNRRGGAVSCFPGLANGAYRLLQAIEQLEDGGGGSALVHSTENLLGTASATTTALLVEAA